jgi:cation diffusion facilitator family transporter
MDRKHHHALEHSHTFGQDLTRPGERRTHIVIAITAVTMAVEVVTGILFGSMALLADGLHMASHFAALSINAFAYAYARRHARNRMFSFGTGKVNALGGYSGAVLLAVFALIMAVESVGRFFNPVQIVFNQAILVAVLGLIVNGVCVFILGADDRHNEAEHHDHHHVHDHHHHHDHNLRSAYLHVMADALTSVLAIVALFAAKYLGWIWMDPLMGIVGALLVTRWSLGLLRTTAGVLLDRQGPDPMVDQIRKSIETHDGSRVTDLHLWAIGPNLYTALLTVTAPQPATVAEYKARIPRDLHLAHISIEVHQGTPPRDSAPH